jgi:hypothetical protein
MLTKTKAREVVHDTIPVDAERARAILREAGEAKRVMDARAWEKVRPSAADSAGICLAWARTTPAHAEATRQAIAESGLTQSARLLHRLTSAITEGTLLRPSKDEGTAVYYALGDDVLTAVKVELNQVGSTWLELEALAFQAAGRQRPELFSAVTAEALDHQREQAESGWADALSRAREIPLELLLGIAIVENQDISLPRRGNLVERLIDHFGARAA